jgi:adenylate cyclase
VAADIVGFSRLVERDENGTLAAIKTLQREIIDPLPTEHRGRIVKLLGDGAIAEFGSAVDAATFAIAMQKEVTASQAEISSAIPPTPTITVCPEFMPSDSGPR